MVDPTDVIIYDRNDAQLQEFLLFGVSVAGKTASTIAKQLQFFLEEGERMLNQPVQEPFKTIRELRERGKLMDVLKKSRLGQYSKLKKAFTQLVDADYDLRTCTPEDLERIHGIGPKTSRFFIIFTRPGQDYAVLDTHILKYISKFRDDVPKSTPSGRKYRELETWFLDHCRELGVDPTEYDLELWNLYSTRSGKR